MHLFLVSLVLLNFLIAMEHWIHSLDSGSYMYGCYLPWYNKSFNTIPHAWLLPKLKPYSIGGDLLQWITHYLLGRKCCVVLNRCKSNWEPDVRSSVPQGTTLGPILSLTTYHQLWIANVWCLLTTPNFINLFTLIVMYFSCKDFDALYEWSSELQVSFNFPKCTFLTSGHPSHSNDYLMESFHLEYAKHLGITVDSHFSPTLLPCDK